MDTLTGQIDEIIYQNDPFIIARLKSKETVKGSMADPQRGSVYTFTGRWENHPQYGRQFSFIDYTVELPTSEEAIREYLEENAPNIGPQRSLAIVKTFGEETLTICKDFPERLAAEIPGISTAGAERIAHRLRELAEREAMEIELKQIFTGSRITRRTIEAIKLLWGVDAPKKIKQNPYRLIDEDSIPGVGFIIADQIARNCGYEHEGEGRIRAGIIHVMNEAAWQHGHVCLTWDELTESAAKLLAVTPALVDNHIAPMVAEGKLLLYKRDWETWVYLPNMKRDEELIASKIHALLDHKLDKVHPGDMQDLYDDQRQAMQGALSSSVFILTGAPGTGKTWTVNRIVAALEPTLSHIALAAPTGKAAKRMTELTGRPAHTIHRLLEPEVGPSGEWHFSRDMHDPIEADVVIVDELSMTDQWLMARLLDAIQPGTRLILVGDIYQLPSVGPGNVLGDLIKSGIIPCVELTTIKRQDPGLIITNCHRIKEGQDAILSTDAGGDFVFVSRQEPKAIQTAIVELAVDRIPARFDLNPMRDIQVLSPVRETTELSCKALNEILQDRLNPVKDPMFQGKKFRPGDKVIQTKNDYEYGIVNGDLGYIREIHRRELIVEFENPTRLVHLPVANNDLELGYCLTTHRYQGSECPVIIIPVHRSLSPLVTQRPWLYTSLSRARSLCVVVGQGSEVGAIIRRNWSGRRKTNLTTMLQNWSGMVAREEVAI